MVLTEIIDDIFYSLDPEEEKLTDYVSCIDLAPVRRVTWSAHTDDRVTLASMLSVCAHITNNLRFCARKLAKMYNVSIRRLEEYAKYCGFVMRGIRWFGYGKLVEATLYYAYIHAKRRRWERHLEVRLYFTIPVHFTAYDLLLETIIDDLDEIAREIIEHWYGLEFEEELDFDREESLKHGLRPMFRDYAEFIEEYISERCPMVYEIMSDAVHAPCCLTKYWCNDYVRSSYSFIQAIIVDYRLRVGYSKNYCYMFDKDELKFIDIESYIEKWFRWW